MAAESVSQYLADQLGQSEQMAELERQYASGAISNSVVAEEQAKSYWDIPLADIVSNLAEIPSIEDIDATILGLRERGIESILGTVTWSFAAQEFQRRHGFAAVSGTEAKLRDGVHPLGLRPPAPVRLTGRSSPAARARQSAWSPAGARTPRL